MKKLLLKVNKINKLLKLDLMKIKHKFKEGILRQKKEKQVFLNVYQVQLNSQREEVNHKRML